MYRVVVDTNVVVSAAISVGKSYEFLLNAVLSGKCALVTSDEIINEIREVLCRPKFRLGKNEISSVVSALESLSNIIETKSKFSMAKDPDDDMFINAAYDGGADYIVSGDRDLLDLE
jgi:putative PIN family toxin of toxin-antitoxin system